ncbi:MAG: MBL fold metallo-hydrolase, partial [Bacilli bacterium]|nr:MBL fold metallo-hydrolase [Bacilli bacterium]
MKVCVLASGSGGNSTLISTDKYNILIDIGKNRKYIVGKLESINVKPESIDYIFISHLHDDHISALKTFIKKYKPTIVISQPMFQELTDIHDYPHILVYEDEVILENLRVTCMHSSHDATDSRNFLFESNGHSVVYVTDTGYVNHKNFKYLTNKEIYLFESNHDVEKLQHGPYPSWLKKRVLSDCGHLSNNACSVYLSKLIGNNTKKIYLMHLSEKNNTEELALNEIHNIF